MAILTIDQFAERCCIKRKDLMVYIKRKAGNRVVADGEMVDANEVHNVKFYNSREAKGKLGVVVKPGAQKQIPREETWVDPDIILSPPQPEGEPDKNGILPYNESEKRKKHWEAIVTERNAGILKLKTKKLEGEVIPVSPIENIVFKYKQYLITQQKIAYEAFLNEIGQKYAMVGDDIAYYRGRFIKGINNSFTTADTEFTNNLELILQDFSIKRGVGERE